MQFIKNNILYDEGSFYKGDVIESIEL